MMNANPPEIEVPLSHFVKMNILLWNCRGALNVDFKRRIFENVVNHRPSILVVTETRVGGDRAGKIIEGCHLTVTLPRIQLAMPGDCGYSGERMMWMFLPFQLLSRRFMLLLRCVLLI